MNEPPNHEEEFSVRDQFAGQADKLENPEPRPAAAGPSSAERILGGKRNAAQPIDEPLRNKLSPETIAKSFDFLKILAGMQRRKKLVLIAGAAGLLLFAPLGVKVYSVGYSAQSTLLYRKTKSKEFKVSEATSFSLSSFGKATVVSMIKIRSNLQEVLKRLDLSISAGALRDMVSVETDKSTDLVKLAVHDAPTENVALKLANTLADVAVQNNALLYKAQASRAYEKFNAQALESKRTYEDVQAQMTDFQKENKILQLSADNEAYLERLSETTRRLSEARIQYNGLLLRISNYKQLIEEIPDEVVRESYEDNPLKRELVNTESALLTARTQYGSRNPKVTQLESKVQELRKMISDARFDEGREKVYERNPMKEVFEQELLRLEAEKAVALKQVETLKAELDSMENRFETMPDIEKRYAFLFRQLSSSENLYNALKSNAELARLAMQMDLADFELVETASKAARSASLIAFVLPILGLFMGSGAGFVFALGLEVLDKHFRTRKEIELAYNVPCLAAITQDDTLVLENAYDRLLPEIREITEQLAYLAGDKPIQSLLLASAVDEEGKSLLGLNLARYYAGLGVKTLYADFDTRDNEVLNRLIDPESRKGIDHYLQDQAALDDLIVHTDGLDVCKTLNPAPGFFELMKSRQMLRLWDAFRSQYELVIVESPPLEAGPVGEVLADMADRTVFLIGSGVSAKGQVNRAFDRLEQKNIRPTGIVFNRVRVPRPAPGEDKDKKAGNAVTGKVRSLWKEWSK